MFTTPQTTFYGLVYPAILRRLCSGQLRDLGVVVKVPLGFILISSNNRFGEMNT